MDKNILIVADDLAGSSMLRKILEDDGYTVHKASGPGAGYWHLRDLEMPVDLLLTDVRMAGMTGPELARKAVGLRPSLSVVFMSDETAPGSLFRQGDCTLNGSLSADEVLRVVRTALETNWTDDTLRGVTPHPSSLERRKGDESSSEFDSFAVSA